MADKNAGRDWLIRQAESEAKKDIVPRNERVGSVFAVVGAFVVFLFFYLHQTWETGFFTSGFGSAEAFFLYVPIVLAAMSAVARAVTGHKNVVRPSDVTLFALAAVGFVWLYIVFPFSFSHFADVLPEFLRFVLAWITDDIARLFMILMFLGSLFVAIYMGVLYVFVRRELLKSKKDTA